MSNKSSNRQHTCKWRLGALLPLGTALSGAASVAEPITDNTAIDDQEMVMDDVKVKAAREKQANRFKAETSTTDSKTEMALRDIPQSISIVKEELIESQNAFNLRDCPAQCQWSDHCRRRRRSHRRLHHPARFCRQFGTISGWRQGQRPIQPRYLFY